ncbi:hypothetical protein GCM10009648_43360 [Tsukamurella spumae]
MKRVREPIRTRNASTPCQLHTRVLGLSEMYWITVQARYDADLARALIADEGRDHATRGLMARTDGSPLRA